ncbi:MAG TPA: isoprenylcysteine carboxylmethyltransferase family protein [Tepidisphaeraceae bacterium]|nr:isoprenylcysteine carboxylmethyltransferase family protein [Tepidisphaeraceae bacterium]
MPLDWPALIIGLLTGAYWGRVIKLVFKTKRTTGKAGNFWPAERLGQVLRVIWYPTVIAWIVWPLIKAWTVQESTLTQPLYENWIIRCSALGVALVAYWLTLICWRKMGTSWRMGIDPNEKTQLIVTGPYAYVRHPIYTLQAVIMLASLAAVPSIFMAIIAVLLIALLYWEARREEQYLLRTHGPVYGRYLSAVGRFIPKSASPAQL